MGAAPLDSASPAKTGALRCSGHGGVQPDPAVSAALEQAATAWLEDAGYHVEEAGRPVRRGGGLWLDVLMNEAAGSMGREIGCAGDPAIPARLPQHMLARVQDLDRDAFVEAMAMRTTI